MAERIGILGATSPVGSGLCAALAGGNSTVVAHSRRPPAEATAGIEWRQLGTASSGADAPITDWICVAPIWVLPEHFALLEASGARRVVALSSTSLFVKGDSSDAAEQAIASQLAAGEQALQDWAQARGIEWVVLRPTLIYGLGRDKNICEIARFVRRFGFFPVFGAALGRRQPIHSADVANACLLALRSPRARNRGYNISGGETLSYREMVRRVFAAEGRTPRLVTVPLAAFRLAVALLRRLPRFRLWSVAMAERMNRDLVFDPADAIRDFGFSARPFGLSAQDLP